MHNEDLFSIGDVARRTGLTVSAIRFYSDEGIVPPTALTNADHRLYDLRAVAQLELIRTLRDLGTGLEEIRRLLGGEMTLHYLLAEHLDLVEHQEHEMRTRRAVLRALTKQNDPAERAVLIRKLVSMSDDERERLIDDFWTDVSGDIPADFIERLRTMRPILPDDPTAGQLQAWIELADLVSDEDFRADVRSYLHDTFAVDPGPRMTAAPVQDFIYSGGQEIMTKIIAAHHSGLPADSSHARELATRLADETAEAVGARSTGELRDRLAAGFLVIEERYQDALNDPQYEATHGRYLSLLAAINGTPPDANTVLGHDVDFAELGAWLSAALSAGR